MGQDNVAATARRFGLSEAAGQALFDALATSGGRQAQFSHPELGGMGQWSGGMTQIGDMFNADLKARVAGFCEAMAPAAVAARSDTRTTSGQWQSQGAGPKAEARPVSTSPWAVEEEGNWWPSHLGMPTASGAQNSMRYACFPERHRLAIERDGTVTLYDTGAHRLSGFAQQQSHAGHLAFSSQDGPVAIESLRVVEC